MRIAFAASPQVAIASILAVQASKHDLVRIFSQPDRPAGRGRGLLATPVSEWAHQNSLELHCPEKSSEMGPFLADIDCVVTVGYGQLIPQEIIDLPRYGFINIHFSLLPRWRGAAPVQRAIEAGDSISGVTIFALDKGMDTGPTYLMKRFALDLDITSDELLAELGEVAPEALLETLTLIEDGVRPVAQSSVGASHAAKLTRVEGRIDWSQSASIVSAKIRAFTSNPGAWTTFRGEVLKIKVAGISEVILLPGELSLIDGQLHVGSTSTALIISSITPAGRSATPANSWFNGARLKPGELFE